MVGVVMFVLTFSGWEPRSCVNRVFSPSIESMSCSWSAYSSLGNYSVFCYCYYRRSFLRVRLLVGCGGLMDDLGRFHGASSSACPLCHYVCEDALHFIAVCPHLHSACLTFLASAPPSIFLLLMILSGCVMWFSDSVGSLISLYRYF